MVAVGMFMAGTVFGFGLAAMLVASSRGEGFPKYIKLEDGWHEVAGDGTVGRLI